ncbi:hypothetical protein JCM6882_002961 [Rhodosporidiobolus microsporus]
MPMPPAFFLAPPIPGQPGASAYIYDDVWDEVADRSYAGYGCLGSVQAAETLTPTPDARPSESSDYGFPSGPKPAYTDYRSPAAPGYKDDPALSGHGKTEMMARKSGGGKEMDWMDRYRKPAPPGGANGNGAAAASSTPSKSSSLAPPRGGMKVVMRQPPSSPPSSSSASSPTSPSKPTDHSRDDDDEFGDFAGEEVPQRDYRRRSEEEYGAKYSEMWR